MDNSLGKLAELEQRLQYQFSKTSLLKQALTHRSLVGVDNNERLEFLGDAVLGHLVSEALFQRYPNASEGELSRMRSSLVCGDCLAKLARTLGLGSFLNLGVGERKSGGGDRGSILADAFEALIAAVYLDGGIEVCRDVVLAFYGGEMDTLSEVTLEKDAKSTLQEWLQARRLPLPSYKMSVMGEAHAQTFQVICRVDGLPHEAKGVSTNRRQAEQAAAKAYLELLNGC